MKTRINEIEFQNDVGEYLDVTVNNSEKYITLDLETSTKFSMDKKDWKELSRKINEIFREMEKEEKPK